MKQKIFLAGLILTAVFVFAACGKEEKKEETNNTVQGEQTQEPEIDTFLTDDNYDPSVANFIGKARVFAEGYEENYGSNQRKLGNNTTVFIGDSFFDHQAFWPDFYTLYYVDKDVFLAGIGSTTAKNWMHLADTVFYSFKDTQPRNIVVHLGTNDLWVGEGRVDDVAADLQGLFSMLHQKFPNTKIYYFSITHRGDEWKKVEIPQVNDIMRDWCEQNSSFMTFIDTSNKIMASDLMADNLHPLRSTYQKFVDALAEAGCEIADAPQEQ